MRWYLLILTFTLLFGNTQAEINVSEKASLIKKERRLQRFLLITGCARSGTSYISHFLEKSGMDMPHERIGKDGAVSWPMAIDSKSTPWGPSSYLVDFAHTFHQVRHPLKVIASVYANEPKATWNYICSHIPEIYIYEPLLVRCAKYWYYWNLAAEKKAEWTYRIEDLPRQLEEMSLRVGRQLSLEVLDTVPKNLNTRNVVKRDFTWEDLRAVLEPEFFDKLQALARRYGYKID
jgi:hypothetical protein